METSGPDQQSSPIEPTWSNNTVHDTSGVDYHVGTEEKMRPLGLMLELSKLTLFPPPHRIHTEGSTKRFPNTSKVKPNEAEKYWG